VALLGKIEIRGGTTEAGVGLSLVQGVVSN